VKICGVIELNSFVCSGVYSTLFGVQCTTSVTIFLSLSDVHSISRGGCAAVFGQLCTTIGMNFG
jgi:hypothetical protein